jgi:hypothetical protein
MIVQGVFNTNQRASAPLSIGLDLASISGRSIIPPVHFGEMGVLPNQVLGLAVRSNSALLTDAYLALRASSGAAKRER